MNLEEVARRAGVSTATVSRVLNNVSQVKAVTRNRVMKAVAELGYQPNLHARSLAGARSRTIGVIVSNLANPFFFDIFQQLEFEALAAGYEVVVANTDYEPDRLRSSIHLMIGRRVAGLAVLVSEMHPDLIQLLTDNAIRAVFYDVGKVTDNIANIRVNYRKGMEQMLEYLHSLGHQRMAFIGHHASLGPIHERQRTFGEVVEHYLPRVEYRAAAASDTLEGGRQAARDLLSSGFHPTAIVCVNDFMALGVLRELRDRSLRVPADVSVTGFDNIKLSEFCFPALTTLHIPRDRIGSMAFAHLREDPASPRAPGRDLVIDPELLVRDSTASPPATD